MNNFIYFLGRMAIRLIQCLPLWLVARLGRMGGWVAFYLDGRHRRVALKNLTMCFDQEKSLAEITAIARENFRRIGENYVCLVKTANMSFDALRPHLEFAGFDRLPAGGGNGHGRNIVAAIGHFGNFELYARIQDIRPDLQGATTYRALKQPVMNRLMESLRGVNQCRYYERRTGVSDLRKLMDGRRAILGLLVDQHSLGLRAPFLGHDCHTNLAPAVLALRYNCDLYSIICHRTSLAKWRLEVGEKIMTHVDGLARSTADIMQDVNRALESAVRQDPANWFWVHRRWKT